MKIQLISYRRELGDLGVISKTVYNKVLENFFFNLLGLEAANLLRSLLVCDLLIYAENVYFKSKQFKAVS